MDERDCKFMMKYFHDKIMEYDVPEEELEGYVMACKAYWQATGLTPNVEVFENYGEPIISVWHSPMNVWVEFHEHVFEDIKGKILGGDKIPAIKEVRQATGMGLKEAKQLVDDYSSWKTKKGYRS